MKDKGTGRKYPQTKPVVGIEVTRPRVSPRSFPGASAANEPPQISTLFPPICSPLIQNKVDYVDKGWTLNLSLINKRSPNAHEESCRHIAILPYLSRIVLPISACVDRGQNQA
jgi:hypothetical protein